jgi:hypothetical protein
MTDVDEIERLERVQIERAKIMTGESDIVARLRAHAAYWKSSEFHSDIADDLRRAADEIERLRGAVRAEPTAKLEQIEEDEEDDAEWALQKARVKLEQYPERKLLELAREVIVAVERLAACRKELRKVSADTARNAQKDITEALDCKTSRSFCETSKFRWRSRQFAICRGSRAAATLSFDHERDHRRSWQDFHRNFRGST